MAVITDFSRLQAGMSATDAMDVFAAYCNNKNTLFAPDHWLRPFREKLLEKLPGTINPDHVTALRTVLLEEVRIEVVLFWLTEESGLGWDEFKLKLTRMAEDAQREAIRGGYFPWDDVEACRAHHSGEAPIPAELAEFYGRAEERSVEELRAAAEPCPFCRAPFDELTRVYFVSPAWTWEERCGRAGWLTICDHCHVQVQFFCDLMN
jgi:hypothetical protein